MFKIFVIMIVLIELGNSKTIGKDVDIVWFPNPNGDGLIPAQLTPSPNAMVGDPADVHFYLYTK